jgi:hypothetical protein
MIEEFESARIDTLKKMLTLDDEFALDAQLVGLFERDNIKLNVLYPSLQILAGLAAGYAISHGSKPFFWAFCVLLFASLFFTYRIINKIRGWRPVRVRLLRKKRNTGQSRLFQMSGSLRLLGNKIRL